MESLVEIEPRRPSRRTPRQRSLSSDQLDLQAKVRALRAAGAPHFHRGGSTRRPQWTLLAWSSFACLVDFLIAVSLTCFLSLAVIVMTGVSWSEASLFLRLHFRIEFLICIFLVYSITLVTLRVFAGCSLGEWACGLRLGEPRHRIAHDYSLKVMQRALLVFGTGIVTLPILSLLTGEDQAGRLVGLPLVMQSFR